MKKNRKMNGRSWNPQAELKAKLLKEMPEIFSEGKIDTVKLKATLGEDVPLNEQERYGLNWNGKMNCFKKIQETTTNTLKPCREESVNFDDTENLFIEGDNLQVLKVLQKSYYGKVKMIYIDPPYNTGNDFIYNDKFSRTKREELIANGSLDEDGNIVNHDLYRQNTRDSGHFHSDWMNMMYPRLFLARNLLRQDGVIFVSIDDNEVKNLRAMMDEIFGEENFVGEFVVIRAEGGGLANQYVKGHDYLLTYARNLNKFEPLRRPKEIRGKIVERNSAKYWIEEDWLRKEFGKYGTLLYEDIENVKGLAKKEEIDLGIKNGEYELIEKRKGQHIVGRLRLIEEDGSKFYSILKHLSADGNDDLASLKLKGFFDFPKPLSLLRTVVLGATFFSKNKEDIILDFFAGSGTTAHAVMQLNAEDGGNRKWICVQLPEKCKEESEAAKAGFATIADIAKERIRRAGKIIQKEKGDQLELDKAKLDLGFKVFKLDETSFKVWNTQIKDVEQLEQQLMDFVDNVKPEALTENLLYELIIKSGLELNVPIEEKHVPSKVEGKAKDGAYYRIGNGDLIICLVDKLTQLLFDAILADKPEKIIVLDRAFANNDQLKTNMLLSAEHAGVKEFKVI